MRPRGRALGVGWRGETMKSRGASNGCEVTKDG